MRILSALASGNVRRFVDASHRQGLAALDRRPSSAMLTLASVAMMLISSSAFADTATSGVTGGADATIMLANICTFILGPFGQTIAVLGIIGIGMAWMFGRASLGLIAGVIGGIIIMFGASFLGQMLTAVS